jgi:hypothetical protein
MIKTGNPDFWMMKWFGTDEQKRFDGWKNLPTT